MAGGLTDAGFEAKRASEILIEIRAEYVRLLGVAGLPTDVDFDFDVFLGNITAVLSDRLGTLWELLQAIYDTRDSNNATGVNLSILAAITGALRRESTFGTVPVDFTGDADKFIPAGTIYEGGGDTDSARWVQRDDVTLDGGGLASGVTLDSQEAGTITAAPGAVDDFVTPVSGLQTVTNPASAAAGLERETDPELRLKRLDLLQLGGSAAAAAIRAEVLTVSGVTAVLVLENETDAQITIEGVVIDARSVAVVVHPASITDAQKQAVGEAIYLKVCAGTSTTGALSVTVTGTDLAPKIVRFSLSTTLDITVRYDVQRETGVDVPEIAEIKTELIAATTAFFAGLSLGEDVRILPISCLAEPVEGVRSVTVILTPSDLTRIQPTGDIDVFNNELPLNAIVPPLTEAVIVNEV